MTPFTRQVIFFSGFRQSEGADDGVRVMFRRAIDTVKDETKDTGEFIYVRRETWDCNLRSLAEGMLIDGTKSTFICGYSWGAGRAATQLAWELRKRGITVTVMVLIDPVRFISWLPWFLQPTAMIRYLRELLPIRLPDNVLDSIVMSQSKNRPGGFPVRPHYKTTDWEINVTQFGCLAQHEDMHKVTEIQDIVNDALRHFIKYSPIRINPFSAFLNPPKE